MRAAVPALLLMLAPAALGAQPLAVSRGPDAVSVTVYRGDGEEMQLGWLEGYALVTETRTVDLPAGPSELRFEGVAGGIIPVSAIVTGLPGGVAEKNRDARLLSPGGLIDANLGRRVHVRRTNRATGAVTETEAVLRSGPDGVVLQTEAGVEALRCTGLAETVVYDAVAEGLTDRPTLAVRTVSPAPTRSTMRLSYLATGFDWRANYVVGMAPDGRTLDLFAWLTLANSNDESFVAAQTQAVAGAPNKEDEEEEQDPDEASAAAEISLQCWPAGNTSNLPYMVPPTPGEIGAYAMEGEGEDIVVTGSRIQRQELMSAVPLTVMTAEQEELGDLKLYRIPEPVTVAANAQKQVALLTKSKVRFERLYGGMLDAQDQSEPAPMDIVLRLKNEKKSGLGVPLPSGNAAVFENVGGRPMLAGEGSVDDTAVGQELDLEIGESSQVMITQRLVAKSKRRKTRGDERRQIYEIEISNANPHPIEAETVLRLFQADWRLVRPGRKLSVRNSRQVWRTTVPANGRSTLTYKMEKVRHPGAQTRVRDEVEEEADEEAEEE